MISTIFYSFIIFMSLIVNLLFNRTNKSLGIVLLAQYLIVSLFSIIILKNDLLYFPKIKLTPYLILLISYFITFYPFLNSNNNFNKSKFNITYYEIYNYLIYLYIGFAFISILVYFPQVKELIIENNWLEHRNMVYSNSTDVVYNNFFQRIALIYVGYFRTFALIVYFIFLKYNYKPKLRIALLISIIGTILLASMNNVSRGMIYDFFILFFSMYLFFKNKLSRKSRRKITIFIISIGIFFLIFAIVVTISRFSSNSEFDINSINSLIKYFGMSPLVFNNDVFSVLKHTGGIYSFGRLFELFGMKITYPSQFIIGGNWGTSFYTYVGLIYIDFGILGVIIHALLINFVLSYLFRTIKFSISKLFLIFTIYQYLLKGAFVIGRSYIIELVINIFVFIIIYSLENIKFKKEGKTCIDLSA